MILLSVRQRVKCRHVILPLKGRISVCPVLTAAQTIIVDQTQTVDHRKLNKCFECSNINGTFKVCTWVCTQVRVHTHMSIRGCCQPHWKHLQCSVLCKNTFRNVDSRSWDLNCLNINQTKVQDEEQVLRMSLLQPWCVLCADCIFSHLCKYPCW